MGFEQFPNQVMCPTDEPIVSINKGGSIVFNTYIIKKYRLDKNIYCDLFFDKESREIGLRFFEIRTHWNSRKLSGKRKENRGWLNCAAFMRWIDHDFYSGLKRYVPYERDGLLIIDLKEPIKPFTIKAV